MKRSTVSLVVVAGAFTLAAAYSPPASACGGLFCSAINPVPVDQSAERILFEIDEDQQVTVTVEIKYAGDPQDFSWILPVPEAPTLGVMEQGVLELLDAGTAPTFQAPPFNCFSGGGFGCADVGAVDFNQAEGSGGDGVQVENLPRVGPYDDIVVVSSEDPDALSAWLNDNDYLVTEAMQPYIDAYVEQGFSFLAVRLAADAGVRDIAPIQYSCPMEMPFIPLTLTAVAAEPEMTFVVMFSGDTAYLPENFRAVEIPTDDVRVHPVTGQMNYPALASWRLDEEGGRAFISEYIGDGEDARGRVLELHDLGTATITQTQRAEIERVLDRPRFTRLYTRLNPAEMTEDPFFRPAPDAEPRDGFLDLSDQDLGCSNVPVPCGESYCGEGSECAVTCVPDDSDDDDTAADDDDDDDDCDLGPSENGGCACKSGTAARKITTALGEAVTCQEEVDLLAGIVDAQDVCDGISCGKGACTAIGGVAVCKCESGAAAFLDEFERAGITCKAAAKTYGPEQLLWPDVGPEEEDDTGGCRAAGGAAAPFAVLAVVLFAVRRARRRR